MTNRDAGHRNRPKRFRQDRAWHAGSRCPCRPSPRGRSTVAVQASSSACSRAANPSDEQLLFLKQLGASYVSVGSPPDLRTAEGFMQIKKRYADAGITVWNIGNTSVHNMPEVTLNLPGRDQKIEEYKQYLRNLGKAGIGYSTYAHMGNGIWTSGRTRSVARRPANSIRTALTARGQLGRQGLYRAALPRTRVHQGRDLGELHLFHQAGRAGRRRGGRADRHSSRRSAGARAGRRAPLIFSNFAGYKRAMEIANSPNVGICLCCGTWLEGGKKLTGKDPEEMIRHFGAGEDLEDPLPQRQRPVARISSRRSWTTATTTCGRS